MDHTLPIMMLCLTTDTLWWVQQPLTEASKPVSWNKTSILESASQLFATMMKKNPFYWLHVFGKWCGQIVLSDKSTLKNEESILTKSPPCQERPGVKRIGHWATCHPQSRSSRVLTFCILFSPDFIPAHGKVPSIFSKCLPVSFNPRMCLPVSFNPT